MMALFMFIVLFLVAYEFVQCQVIELDGSFSEKKEDRPWLVEFYAPWCGHCRQLEPVYQQVSTELKSSGIYVAKVDATRYSQLASEYDVRGYPTIKFIQGDKTYTYTGERTKEGIAEFARRALGPVVRVLVSQGKLYDARMLHKEDVFFLYVGSVEDTQFTAYKLVAQKFAVLSYFYSIQPSALPDSISLLKQSSVLVFKDGALYEFHGTGDDDMSSGLESWVNVERFRALPRLGGVGLNEMSHLGKYLAIVVTDDKDKLNDDQKRTVGIVQAFITEHREKYHSRYQFAWLTDPDVAGNIIMSSVQVPFIFILDPSNHEYYIPSSVESWTATDLDEFLDSVLLGKLEAQGGTGFMQRFKRLFYDIWSTIYGIYNESPWLALVVFGIPSFVIFIICYTLCCMEPMDDNDPAAAPDSEDEYEDELLEGSEVDTSLTAALKGSAEHSKTD